jgi:hypothetical protein
MRSGSIICHAGKTAASQIRYLYGRSNKFQPIEHLFPYRYRGFGLNISSEIEFPELYAADFTSPDVEITISGTDAGAFEGRDSSKMFHVFGADEFILNIPGTGRYQAIRGRQIRLEPHPGSEMRDTRIYVLTVCMAALLMQRGRILLHASAILHRGRLQLFMGDSGAGKSSILAELWKRGHKPFTDDVCVLSPSESEEETYMAHATYPMMKLWQQTISELDDGRFDASHRIWSDTDKYGQFFHESFLLQSYPVERIFILDPDPLHAGGYQARRITGIEAFSLLTEHTYRKQFIHYIALQAAHSKAISSLVQGTEISMIKRPLNGSRIDSFADFIEALL